MKRKIFWMVWGVASLVCIMIAGYKSFAIEVENHKMRQKPSYVVTEKEAPEMATEIKIP